MSNQILVSILVVTFNHEKYIEQCLKSLLDQETSFQYEIVICNDASTDSTLQKCETIIGDKHNIQLHNHENNIGVSANFEFGIRQCKGKYMALCDGDDYWTHPQKLQMMVDYFALHADCSLVYTDSGRLDENTDILTSSTLKDQPEKYQIADILDKVGPAVNAMMIRKSVFPNRFPKQFFQVVNPDIFMNIWALDRGYGHYIDIPMSVYRVHDNGVWNSIDKKERNIIHWGSRVIAFGTMGQKYQHLKEECISQLIQYLASNLDKGNSEIFKRYFKNLPLKQRAFFRVKRAYYKWFIQK